MVIGFGLVYSYFAAYSKQGDVALFLSQLLTESAQRSALENKWSSIALNLLQSPLQVFYICLPATGLLLYAFNKKVRAGLKGNQLFSFSLTFALIICITFFISAETANRYLYPAFPFIAIISAIIYFQAATVINSSKWLIKYKGILILFAFFAVLRIAYDVWGIPYQLKHAPVNYRALSTTILQHTGGTPVYLTGYPQIGATHALPFTTLQTREIEGPPVIPYQLPYYLTKATNTVMRYDPVPQKGLYYLTPADFIKDKNPTVLFTFFDNWTKRDVVLVKF